MPSTCAAGALAHVIAVHVVAANKVVHATEPGAVTLHVRVVAVLIAKPALQWYVAVVGEVALYANEFSEYVTYPLSSAAKGSHCAGVHTVDVEMAFQENPPPQSDVCTGHARSRADPASDEQQHSRDFDDTDEPQDEVGEELSTRHVDDEEVPCLYGA